MTSSGISYRSPPWRETSSVLAVARSGSCHFASEFRRVRAVPNSRSHRRLHPPQKLKESKLTTKAKVKRIPQANNYVIGADFI